MLFWSVFESQFLNWLESAHTHLQSIFFFIRAGSNALDSSSLAASFFASRRGIVIARLLCVISFVIYCVFPEFNLYFPSPHPEPALNSSSSASTAGPPSLSQLSHQPNRLTLPQGFHPSPHLPAPRSPAKSAAKPHAGLCCSWVPRYYNKVLLDISLPLVCPFGSY